jgi:HlyD family secretion protein
VASSAAEAGHLSVLGTVLPAQRLTLGFGAGGPVKGMYVQVGMEVRRGDLLAELDVADLQLGVREAEEALAFRQAALDQAMAGAWEQEVAVAEAGYRRALAQHEELLGGARPEEVTAAQADYQSALAHYGQVQAGASQEELIAARTAVDKAEAAVQRAQAAYDLVAGRPDVGASPQAAALHDATLDCRAARAQYERLQDLPTRADLQAARAEVARARAQLERLRAGPTDDQVATGAAAVAIAQAQLELARAGPRPEDVAVACVQVQQARTALERTKLPLSRAQLLAPFDGTVAAVYLSPGEWAGPGVPLLELLDTGRWRVETRNVGELNVGRVRVGQEAVVRVIALGRQALRGRVAAISPVAVVQQGDTTYTVFIDLEATDLNLRPGMNVEVEIVTEP